MKTATKATATVKTNKAAAKKAAEAVVQSGRLVPTVAADESEVIAAAFDGVRRRPVCAINESGELVVCCRRTAVKNGWKLEGTLFARNRTGKVMVDSKGKLALVAEKPAPAKDRRTKAVTKADFTKKLSKAIDDILA